MANRIENHLVLIICLISFSIKGYASSHHSDPPRLLIGNWNITKMSTHIAQHSPEYALTIEENGLLVLVCDEAINVASWTWEDERLNIHLESEDSVISLLNNPWYVKQKDLYTAELWNKTLDLKILLIRNYPTYMNH